MNNGHDLRQPSHLRHASRSYAAAVSAATPAHLLRAALTATQHHNSAPVSFAARAALLAESSNSQASIDMFRRLSGTRDPRAAVGGKSDRLPRPTDSARQSEVGGAGSLLDLLDEGWSGPQPAPPAAHQPRTTTAATATAAAAAARPPPGQLASTSASALETIPSFSFDERHLHNAGSPHTTAASVYSTATSGSGYGGCGGHGGRAVHLGGALGAEDEEAAGGGGCDTPRSAASWTSCLSTALPQTEAELQQLDLREVERLAEDAADLQWRAATALRLARQRMNLGAAVHGPTTHPATHPAGVQQDITNLAPGRSSSSPGVDGARRSVRASSRGGVTAVAGHAILRLYLLLLAVAEVVLLWLAQVARSASLGLLHPPRSLVLAPVNAARAAVCLVLFVSDVIRQAVATLSRSPTDCLS